MQTKSEILENASYMFSHQIRRPLTSLLGLHNLLVSTEPSAEEMAQIIGHLGESIKQTEKVILTFNQEMENWVNFNWNGLESPSFAQNTVAHFNQQFNTKIKLHFDLMPQWNIDLYLLKCVLEDFCAYTYLAIRKNSFQEPEIWLKMDESAQHYQLRAKLRGNLLDWEDWNQKQELFINAAFPSPERNWTLSNAAKNWQTKWEISGEDEEYTWFALDIPKKME